MYFNFISLKDAPLNVQIAVENMHMIANCEWRLEDRAEHEEMIASFNDTEKLLADIMNMKYEDEEVLLLFKMAMYRFCGYIPNMIKEFKKRLKKQSFEESIFHSTLQLYQDDLEKWNAWENMFWIKNLRGDFEHLSRMSVITNDYMQLPFYRKQLREQEPIRKAEDSYYKIGRIIESALKDSATIEDVKKLQLKYAPSASKAKQMNIAVTKKVEGQKYGAVMAIQNMRKVTDILERNIQGKLTAGDVVELEKIIPGWKNQVQTVENLFN